MPAHQTLNRHRPPKGREMHACEKFLRFAAECEFMAKITRDKESKLTWRRFADRWIRFARLIDDSSPTYSSLTTQNQMSARRWSQ